MTRKELIALMNYPTLVLGHHTLNAGKAIAHAKLGDRMVARWYGQMARSDLQDFLHLTGNHHHVL